MADWTAVVMVKFLVEGILAAALSAFAALFGLWPLVATILTSTVGLLWLHGFIRWPRRRRKGRKGILDLQIDVPKALRAQDGRVARFAKLSGQLHSALEAGMKAAGQEATDRLALSNRIAKNIRPIASRMTAEAGKIHHDTEEFTNGMNRWLEIAEREHVTTGLVEQIPALAKTLTAGAPVVPEIRVVRGVFEKLRGVSESLDDACGQVVDALDVVTGATQDTVTICESALKRIKRLLEKDPGDSALTPRHHQIERSIREY